MNQIGPEQLLSQIRTMGNSLQANASNQPAPPGGDQFGDLLKSSINAVNENQQVANNMQIGFENGTGSSSLAEVMIASQKADLSFRAMAEVRNKLVSAYQDIMNMPV
jgi:flagellar hook-basal body complex protein FliE